VTHLQTKIIKTKRLVLRNLTRQDLDAYAALYLEADVLRSLFDAPGSQAESVKELEAVLDSYGRYGFGLWAMIHKNTGLLIGRCGLRFQTIANHEEVVLSCALLSPYWGQGLATEAAGAVVQYGFDHLHLPRLIGLVQPQSQASIRVALKAGMVFVEALEINGYVVHLYMVVAENSRTDHLQTFSKR
jgi:[ribosomal protein S5]-alanine N-acetyltransferase